MEESSKSLIYVAIPDPADDNFQRHNGRTLIQLLTMVRGSVVRDVEQGRILKEIYR